VLLGEMSRYAGRVVVARDLDVYRNAGDVICERLRRAGSTATATESDRRQRTATAIGVASSSSRPVADHTSSATAAWSSWRQGVGAAPGAEPLFAEFLAGGVTASVMPSV
jgi:hypothetical protein